MSLDLNKISVGPGALNSNINNELAELYQLLIQLNLENQKEGIQIGKESAEQEGKSAFDSVQNQAMSMKTSALGDILGSATNATAGAVGNFTGGHNATIEENNAIAKNAGDAETLLRGANGQGAMVNKEATQDQVNAALESFAKNKGITVDKAKEAFVSKLKNGKGKEFKQPLTTDEKTLLSTFTKDERESSLSNLADVRKEANAKIKRAQEDRSTRIGNYRMIGEVASGVTKGSFQIGASTYQMKQADAEKSKALYQFVSTAQNNIQQVFSSGKDTIEQKQSKIIDDAALFQHKG
ncbi:MAG: hypothetical protein JSS32_09095 [Verrucomicrobia bacterium]|nr:hypothetical protein [Verrucomicrobiota bacterium]